MSETGERTRPVALSEFIVHQVDETTSPPSQPVLRVSLIGGDLLSLAIEKYDENAKQTTLTRVESVIVDVEPFLNGLVASLASRGRKPR